jgi:uncharacterized protein YcaQ
MKSQKISTYQAKALWIQAQGLNEKALFGKGPQAIPRAIERLGYVQIDTISVIERCHHHILYSRIPDYQKRYLQQAQAIDKTVFEYWTHALAYVPTKDFRFFQRRMNQVAKSPSPWFKNVKKEELLKVFRLIKNNGPISIRDIQDDVLIEKAHEWDSRKPSKKALQLGFNSGRLVISERIGMLKKYDLLERHFAWPKKPEAATENEINDYLLQRALRSQGVVSLDSICHLNAKIKPKIRTAIEKKIKSGELVTVHFEGFEKDLHWVAPKYLNCHPTLNDDKAHILSPFDPLIIQRKRLNIFFDYQHRFEAYIPKEKRVFGYFALPVLVGDKIVAVLDLKTDRVQRKVLIQKWSWIPKQKSNQHKRIIDSELHRFEKFQLQSELNKK